MATKQLSLSFHRLLQNGKDKAAVLQLQCTRDRSMRHVLLRLNNRSLTKSWLRWKSKVNQKKKMKRYVLKWISRRRLFVFLKWLDYVEARIRTRRLMVRVTTRMTRTKLNSGFNSWILVTRHCFQLEKVKKENAFKIRKTLLSMQKKTIFKTINTWKGYVLLRRKYRRCVYRMQNRTLLSVFNTWYDWVENAVAKRKKIRKVMLKMISKQLSMAFRSLVFNTTYQKDQEQIQCNRNRSMTHVLSRLNNRSLTKAWLRWKFRVLQKKKMKRYLCKWMKRQQLFVFMKWCEFVKNIFAQRLQMEKIVFSIFKKSISMAWKTWCTNVAAMRFNAELECNRIKTMKHIITRLHHRIVFKCWSTWLNQIQKSKSEKMTMQKVIQTLRHQRISDAFEGWYHFCEEREARRTAMVRVLLRLHKTQLSSSLNTWIMYSRSLHQLQCERQQNIKRINNVIARMKHSKLNTVMNTWKDHVSLCRRYRKYAGRLQNRTLLAVFNKWNAWMDHCMEVNIKMKRIIFKMKSGNISTLKIKKVEIL